MPVEPVPLDKLLERVRNLPGRIREEMTDVDVRIDPDEFEELAVDYLVEIMRQHSASVVARRFGPVFSVEDLTQWMVGPGADGLTAEAIRERAQNGNSSRFTAATGSGRSQNGSSTGSKAASNREPT